MALYQSILSYDGTEFHGFQRQAAGRRTVQGVVEGALSQIGWRGSSLTAAGRTDAGVHAHGQVIGFELDWGHGVQALNRALNDHLPPDAAVQSSREVGPSFHPRFSAQWRHYRYRVIEAEQRDPLRERYAQRTWPPLRLERLGQLGKALLGRHDFRAFGRAPIEDGHTVRTVQFLKWTRAGDLLWLDVVADAFLQHMVRRVVGASLEVGSGSVDLADVQALLDNPSERWQGSLAKPGGLFLMQVGYRPWDGPGLIGLTEEGE